MAERISLVVPCYNEQQAIPLFYTEACKAAEELKQRFSAEVEFVFVNDGSTDGTLDVLRGLAMQDERVRYLSLSRNFGKEAAMYAGMEHAAGDYVAVMDADLQDPPALLPQMYAGIRDEGYDCVATRRVTRKGEPPIRSFFARRFYRLMNRISQLDLVDGARDYRLMTRQMVEAILRVTEYNRFSKGIFSWVGFSTKWIEYENVKRAAGETKWSFWKLFKYSLEGIVAYSVVPLAIASFLGVLLCVLAFAFMVFLVIRTLVWGDPVAGWPSTMCVILFIGGVQLFSIGILGKYLSKTYLESKHRPLYILKEEGGRPAGGPKTE